TTAGAGTMDLGGLFQAIRTASAQFSPDGGQAFEANLMLLNQHLQLDLEKDLLTAFGPQWVYYSDPATIGEGTMGFTVVNRPPDAAKLEQSLNQLETALNELSQERIPRTITLQFRQTPSNGVTMHYLATPLISPAWAIKDGWFYFGLYPQVVEAALERTAGSPSILDNPAYQAVRTRLDAPQQVHSFS